MLCLLLLLLLLGVAAGVGVLLLPHTRLLARPCLAETCRGPHL
jgi:hypothetical protein